MKVKCLNCGNKVSDFEEACPKCGTKLRWYQKNSPATFGMLMAALFFAFIVFLLIFW
jgi:uncharacterized paraquat-inducible protein A